MLAAPALLAPCPLSCRCPPASAPTLARVVRPRRSDRQCRRRQQCPLRPDRPCGSPRPARTRCSTRAGGRSPPAAGTRRRFRSPRCGASPTGHAHPDAPATAADTAPASGPGAGLPVHRVRHPSPPARPATPLPIPDTAGPGRPTPPRRRGGRRCGRPGRGPGRHSRCRQGKIPSRAPGSRSSGFATCRSTRSPPTSRHQHADHTQTRPSLMHEPSPRSRPPHQHLTPEEPHPKDLSRREGAGTGLSVEKAIDYIELVAAACT